MASTEHELKMTRAEREKEAQSQAYTQLMHPYTLPDNISDMKSFAFGSLTWRDCIAVGASFLVPICFMMLFSGLIGQILSIVIGFVIGIPFAFLSMRHIFTGDLPFEEKLKISLNDRGHLNLLNWDKTKNSNGKYVETSTQSFVPQLEFTEDNYMLLPNAQGGFAIIELAVDDIAQAKNTDMLAVVNSFKRMLNALIQDADATPIQIMLKSIPKNLKHYIDDAEDRASNIQLRGKYLAAAHAYDYAYELHRLDQQKAFYYKYYIVVTFREDAEHVGEETMNTASVRKKRMKEKMSDPINKRAKAAQNIDFAVGMTQEERKAAMRERNKESEFGRKKTIDALERRMVTVTMMLRDLGSTHTEVKPRILSKQEVAKLIFECYNTEDKNVIDSVLAGALDEKSALYSSNMYINYPGLYHLKKKKKDSIVKKAQRSGALREKN